MCKAFSNYCKKYLGSTVHNISTRITSTLTSPPIRSPTSCLSMFMCMFVYVCACKAPIHQIITAGTSRMIGQMNFRCFICPFTYTKRHSPPHQRLVATSLSPALVQPPFIRLSAAIDSL